jgi:hypothetical protein
MSQIIDILAPLQAGCMSFTVNIANDSADSLAAADPTKLAFTNASGKKTFLKGDNFSILSMGFILPEAFTIWKDAAATPLPSIFLIMKGLVSLNGYKIDAIVENVVLLPMENYETAIDIFVDCSKQVQFGVIPITYLNENFTLSTDYTLIKISMKSVPAALNTKVFPITPFLKIAHNYPMI